MTAKRITRQTAAEKQAADRKLTENGIQIMESFIAKYPNDPFIADRQRQLQKQRERLASMTA